MSSRAEMDAAFRQFIETLRNSWPRQDAEVQAEILHGLSGMMILYNRDATAYHAALTIIDGAVKAAT